MIRTAALALAAVIALSACGGGDDDSGSFSVDQIAGVLCTDLIARDTGGEPWVSQVHDCPTADGPTQIRDFASTSDRDAWIKDFEMAGGVVIERGDLWVQTKPYQRKGSSNPDHT